ncbi:MAG: 3-deoxy-manno-octulosonate cytidylyltransferase [candidate division WOR-3 bacterium]
MKLVIAIPSRYSSKRFPGKPLALIKGKPMIEWVYEKAKKVKEILKNSFDFIEIIIATDDERIQKVCEKFNAKVIMTDSSIPSGTDRIYHATKNMDYDYIMNLQGDEPTIYEKDLVRLIEKAVKNNYPSATLIYKTNESIESPDTVKVVIDREGKALYFSRSKIPYGRDFKPPFYLKHIGVYIYRKDILEKFVNLKESYLESIEKLEQLRLLENGIPIYCIFAERDTVPVDRMEDIEEAERLL